MIRVAILLVVLVWATATAALPARGGSAQDLKARIYRILTGNRSLVQGKNAVFVKVLRTGRVLYAHRGREPMIPASNLKILTTAAALDRLGPQFTYHTDLVGPAPGPDGVIQGDVYLRGSGDPTMVSPYNVPGVEPLRFFARQLRQQGVKGITGDVVADDSVFDRQFLGLGWFERYRLDSYSAPVAGLSLNGNVVEVIISSDGVRLDPPSTGLKIVRKAGSGTVGVDRPRGSDVITVYGRVAPGEVVRRGLTVENPPLFTAGAFQEILRKAGVPQKGGIRLIRPVGEPALLDGMKVYARYESPPLFDVIAQINEESDNLFAEHLFKTLGEQTGGRGTAETAQAAVAEFLQRHGVDTSGLRMVDGCGLSVLNRVSAVQMVGALEAMNRHPASRWFWESLPSGGEGTLTYRLGDVNVRAKTGTLLTDSSLSGYVVTAYGQTVAFSLLFNDVEGVWSAVEAQDRIVRLLATWPEAL